jgi:prepilin-type N-terminal cleavage/methylation domain-containing protein
VRCFQPQTAPSRLQRGWTLVEVLVAMGLGSLVMAAVASVTMYSAKTSLAMVNYSDLDSKSRYALDRISRELREANSMVAFQSSASNKSITLTNANDASAVTVAYNSSARTLVLSKTGQPDATLLTECDIWDFALYQRTPYVTPTNVVYYPATNAAGTFDNNLVKLISLSWKCSRTIFAQKVNTESVQAAQIVLRNKQ